MNKILIIPALIVGMLFGSLTVAQYSFAQDRVQEGLNSISTAYPGNTRINPQSSVQDLALKVINWALYLAAIIAVIFIIIGGYYYITARGNDEQSKQGRKTLVNALIGLVLVVFSYLIVQVVYRFLIT